MAPLSHSDKVEAMKQRVVSAVSLFENREGSKQVDIKEIGALVSTINRGCALIGAKGLKGRHAESLENSNDLHLMCRYGL